MKNVITSTHFRRPEYSERSIRALAAQREAASWHYHANIDPGPNATRIAEIAEKFRSSFDGMTIHIREGNPSCNDNTFDALSKAMDLDPYFVVMAEDDVVLGRDSLLYFLEQADAHAGNQEVFTVSAWRHPDGWMPDNERQVRWSDHHQVGKSQWFVPWGWGTWPDRLKEILGNWTTGSDTGPFINEKIMGSWDEHLNHILRGNRNEVQPMISRAINIGKAKGTHRGDVTLEYWIGEA